MLFELGKIYNVFNVEEIEKIEGVRGCLVEEGICIYSVCLLGLIVY